MEIRSFNTLGLNKELLKRFKVSQNVIIHNRDPGLQYVKEYGVVAGFGQNEDTGMLYVKIQLARCDSNGHPLVFTHSAAASSSSGSTNSVEILE